MGCINVGTVAPIYPKKIHPVLSPTSFPQNGKEKNSKQSKLEPRRDSKIANSFEEFNNTQNATDFLIFHNPQDGQNEEPKRSSNPRTSRSIKVHTINDENLEEMISKAGRITNNNEAIRLFNQIASYLTQLNDMQLQTMEKLAYVEASLTELCRLNHSPDCQQHERRALAIYSQFQSDFYQQIVTILNNSAISYEKEGKSDVAIQKYERAIEIIKRYYSIHDERRLILLNNIASVYCEANRKKEGLQIYQKLLQSIAECRINNDISIMIKQNYQSYKK